MTTTPSLTPTSTPPQCSRTVYGGSFCGHSIRVARTQKRYAAWVAAAERKNAKLAAGHTVAKAERALIAEVEAVAATTALPPSVVAALEALCNARRALAVYERGGSTATHREDG